MVWRHNVNAGSVSPLGTWKLSDAPSTATAFPGIVTFREPPGSLQFCVVVEDAPLSVGTSASVTTAAPALGPYGTRHR